MNENINVVLQPGVFPDNNLTYSLLLFACLKLFQVIQYSYKLLPLSSYCFLLFVQVMSKQGEWFETYDQVPERLRTQISPSVFPPSAEQAATFGLQRWLLLYFTYIIFISHLVYENGRTYLMMGPMVFF